MARARRRPGLGHSVAHRNFGRNEVTQPRQAIGHQYLVAAQFLAGFEMNDNTHRLLTDFDKHLGVESLALDENGQCSLTFDETCVYIEAMEDDSFWLLYSSLCQIPSGRVPGSGRPAARQHGLRHACATSGKQRGRGNQHCSRPGQAAVPGWRFSRQNLAGPAPPRAAQVPRINAAAARPLSPRPLRPRRPAP